MLTRSQFGVLVNNLTAWGMRVLDNYEMNQLETLVTPTTSHVEGSFKVPAQFVDDLLIAMKNDRKIEAIKAYRKLTGLGLKEAKDAVERYWPPFIKEDGESLHTILSQAMPGGHRDF